jgi:tetratricopeptide (TPR) repeat protein
VALALLAVESLDLAADAAARALADAQASRDAANEAAARSIHGCVLSERGEFKQARREFRAAGASYRAMRDGVRQMKTVSNIGHSYRAQASAHERDGGTRATFYLRQALRVYRVALASGESPADAAIIEGCMAECELRLGRAAEANAHISRSLILAYEIRSTAILAPCQRVEAEVLQALGRLDAAAAACERAVRAAEDLEHSAMLAKCLRTWSAIEDRRGRFERAKDLEDRAHRVEDERTALLATLREEMVPLRRRYAGPPFTATPR